MKQKLSVFVITKNEERKIARCLEHIKWADEIVILDSISTDKTTNIAKKYTKKVYKKKFEDYADQKQAAINKCTNEWILEIDADEVVTNKLKNEIEKILNNEDELNKHSAFIITRQEYFLKKPLMKSYIIRLYKKEKVKYKELIHERLIVSGAIGKLKHIINHESDKYETIQDRINKNNEYTTREIESIKATGKRLSKTETVARMIIEPCIYFLWLFIRKGLWLKGKRGLIWCVMAAQYHFLIYAKYYEYLYKEKQNPEN